MQDAAVDVRMLDPSEVADVVTTLSLARLHQGDGFYLVAWDGTQAVGHLHLALTDPPELQNVEVGASYRRRGVAAALIRAAEREVTDRGFQALRVEVSVDNAGAQALYRGCGYVDVGIAPQRVQGPVLIRTGVIEVDDVLLTWEKALR